MPRRTLSPISSRMGHLLGSAILASLLGCGDGVIPIHEVDPVEPVAGETAPPEPISIARGPRGEHPMLAGFSPDGRWLAWLDRVEAERTALHLLDISTGRELRLADDVLTMSPRPVHFSSDSAHIAYRTLDEDGSAVYDLGTLRVHRLADGQGHAVDVGVRRSSYRFTPDGRRLIGAGRAGLTVYDLVDEAPIVVAPDVRTSVYEPAEVNLPVSADGGAVAYMVGRAVYIWDFAAGRGRLLDDNALVESLRFDALGRFAFVSGTTARGQMHVVDLIDGDRVVSPIGARFAISADSRRIAYVSAADDVTLMVLDVAAGDEAGIPVPGDPIHMRFSPDGEHLLIATRGEDRRVDLYHHALGSGLTRLSASGLVTGSGALDGQFDPDGARFISTFEAVDGARVVRVLDLASGESTDLGPGGCMPIFGSGVTGYGSVDAFGDPCLAFSARHAFVHVRRAEGGVSQLVEDDAVADTRRVVLDGVEGPLRASPDRSLIVAHSPYDPITRDRELVVVDLMHDRLRVLAGESRWYGALASDRYVAFIDDETIWLADLRAPSP